MKKFLSILFITFLVTTSSAFGCWKKEKPMILFNKNQINQDNVAEFCDTFRPNERIYYLVTTPKKIRSRFLYIQVIKMGKYDRLGYDLVWADTVRLKDEQVYYYDDYFVMSEPGLYVVKVYSKDKPTKVYALAQFRVE